MNFYRNFMHSWARAETYQTQGDRMTNIVLCRRDLADFGQPAKYCCKPVEVRNALGWCEEDRARLPLWPADEIQSGGTVATEETTK